MDTVVAQLRRIKDTYGNGALYFGGGGHLGALHSAGSVARALSMFGGYTAAYGNISSEGAVWAVMATYGDVMVGHGRPDMLNSRLIIMWSWDPVRMVSGPDIMH
jgi:anaerobic dimethyl sulfoxide reductase subunit A